MGELRVVKVSRGVSTILWKRSGNKGNKWYRQSVNVQNYNSYQVILDLKFSIQRNNSSEVATQ